MLASCSMTLQMESSSDISGSGHFGAVPLRHSLVTFSALLLPTMALAASAVIAVEHGKKKNHQTTV